MTLPAITPADLHRITGGTDSLVPNFDRIGIGGGGGPLPFPRGLDGVLDPLAERPQVPRPDRAPHPTPP